MNEKPAGWMGRGVGSWDWGGPPGPLPPLEERGYTEEERVLYFAGVNDGRMRPGVGSVQLELGL